MAVKHSGTRLFVNMKTLKQVGTIDRNKRQVISTWPIPGAGINTERRRTERFNFGMPLTVQWTSGSEQRKAHAVTRDVSSGGMYFFLPEAIPDSPAIEVEMTLPTQITLGPLVRVRCHGRIQRCDLKLGESAGMATMIEKYEFLSGSEEVA